MPRLGQSDSGAEHRGSPRRAPAAAYANGALSRFNFGNVIMLLAFTFILRNLFFHDYRSEEINQLRASGKTQDEINKYVEPKREERRQTASDRRAEYETLKSDVAELKTQVASLQAKMMESSGPDNVQERVMGGEPIDLAGDEVDKVVMPEMGARRRQMELAVDTRPDTAVSAQKMEVEKPEEEATAMDDMHEKGGKETEGTVEESAEDQVAAGEEEATREEEEEEAGTEEQAPEGLEAEELEEELPVRQAHNHESEGLTNPVPNAGAVADDTIEVTSQGQDITGEETRDQAIKQVIHGVSRKVPITKSATLEKRAKTTEGRLPTPRKKFVETRVKKKTKKGVAAQTTAGAITSRVKKVATTSAVAGTATARRKIKKKTMAKTVLP